MTADETYICNLCDDVLGQASVRDYTFPRRSDDPMEIRLSVAAYYPEIRLTITFQIEKTRYDALLQEELLAQGITLVFIDKRVFALNEAKHLQRDHQDDREIVEELLAFFNRPS